jgi:hypothetical protein
VLTQVREIKDLKKQLEEEKAKNALLEQKVALLEQQVHKGTQSPRMNSRKAEATLSPRLSSPVSPRFFLCSFFFSFSLLS